MNDERIVVSHFLKIQTRIRECGLLLAALRDLHCQCRVSSNQSNDLMVRGYAGKQEHAEVVVDLGCGYDVGFRRTPTGYEVVGDWWGIEGNSPLRQADFVQQLNRQYAYHVIRDQVREQNLVVEEEHTLDNGDLVITLSERG